MEKDKISTNEGRLFMSYHYEKQPMEFEQGMKVANLNGSEYRVLEKYSPSDMLLLNEQTGQFLVALGVEYYARYPAENGQMSEKAEYGIEWGQGVYLSATPSEIDFAALRREYGRVEPNLDGSYDIEIRETLSRVEKIHADCLGDAIDEAMKRYKEEQVVLDAGDYKETEYIPVPKR